MSEIMLVTGGLGLIGRSMVPRLKEAFPQYRIVVLDQFIRDDDDYLRADITEYGELYSNIKRLDGKIKYIIHAASEVGRINGEEHPWKMIDSSVKGTLNLIHIAIEHNAKLFYFSTSEVYGDYFDEHEVCEDDMLNVSPFMLNNVYALSKYFGESLVSHYVKNYNLDAVSIRPFMIYGPGVFSNRFKSALDIFIWNLLNGQEINVHKDCIRSWCYIDDFVKGLLLLIKQHQSKPKIYEAFNIGNNTEYKNMEELANYIADRLNADKRLIKVIDFDGKFKSQKKYFSTDKLNHLGFNPDISIEQGIKKMIDWHKSLLGDKK